MVPMDATIFEEQTIYNIIPPDIPKPSRPPTYKSKHNPLCPPTASTFGVSGTSLPGLTNLAGEESETSSCRYALHKSAATMGASPIKAREQSSSGEKNPSRAKETDESLSAPNKQHESSQSKRKEVLKPRVPSRSEKPLMNLISDKNFITSNAVDVILSTPGSNHKGGSDTDLYCYKSKHEYGKAPSYLSKIKQDIQKEYEYVKSMQQSSEPDTDRQQEAKLTVLPNDKRLSLIEALKAKWAKLNSEYQATTHIVKLDTIGKVKRKEYFESTLTQIEKDLEKLKRKFIFVNHP